MPAFYEFFAGGGMVRAGLGPDWTCLFANDVDPKKAAAYRANWGEGEFALGDVRELRGGALPGRPDLVWGSFPCQDLSLAGRGAGLAGDRSGTFYAFWRVIGELIGDGRAPALVVVENVCGALTSHGGRDFAAICRTFAGHGYRCGALVIDAVRFTSQSRPRLFVIGARADLSLEGLAGPAGPFHTSALRRAVEAAPEEVRAAHLWWRAPEPETPAVALDALVEDDPQGVRWHRPEETARLLSLMSPVNAAKVRAAREAGRRRVGLVYRRTRPGADGARLQRAEVRFDGIAGCLRTPAGGSSRQTLLLVEGERVRSRLLSPREAARLMGLGDDYRLPANYNEAYHLLGDGVVVPVVRRLAAHLLEPIVARVPAPKRGAA